MSKLKNTPWRLCCDNEGYWYVIDNKHMLVSDVTRDEPTAKAIAALPETLERLEQLEEAARNAVLQIEYLHEKFNETGSGNQAIVQLKKALEE